MDTLNKDPLDMTIEEFTEAANKALKDLEPTMRIIQALEETRRISESWESNCRRQEMLLRTVINERDEALKRVAILSKT